MTTTDVAVTGDLNQSMEFAKVLAKSDLLPEAFRDKPANVLLATEYGRALGIEPMAAINGIQVIKGKPTASAQLVSALVRRAGHKLRVTGDDHKATAQIVRSDDPDYTFTSTWTMERAKTAGLTQKGGSWKTYPGAMLKARAITEVARDACADVLAGVSYTAEELDGTPEQAVAPQNGGGSQAKRTPKRPAPTPPPSTSTPASAASGFRPGGLVGASPDDLEPLDVDTDTGEVVEAELLDPEDLG